MSMQATSRPLEPSRTAIVIVPAAFVTAIESRTLHGSTPLHQRAFRATWWPAIFADSCSIDTSWTFCWPGLGVTKVGCPGTTGGGSAGWSGGPADAVGASGGGRGGGADGTAPEQAANAIAAAIVRRAVPAAFIGAQTTVSSAGFRLLRESARRRRRVDPRAVLRLPAGDVRLAREQVTHLVGTGEQH